MSATAAMIHCQMLGGREGLFFEPRWYAIWTRSRHEKVVAERLQHKEVETFLPLYRTLRRWRKGDHHVELPLFPGYGFVRIALRDRLSVLRVPGVVRLVGFNGIPTPLEDSEVEGLQRALMSGVKAAPHPYLTIGHRVQITAGPLAGYEGILVRRKGNLRVVLSIDVVQRSIVVDADLCSLEPAPSVCNGRIQCPPWKSRAGSFIDCISGRMEKRENPSAL